jgi:hypothetical protein
VRNPYHSQITCGRRVQRRWTRNIRRWQTASGQLGRERPSRQHSGHSGAKATGENRRSLTPPVRFTDTSARRRRAAKNAARFVSGITATLCITSSSLAPLQRELASRKGSRDRSRRRRRGNAHPESFIPSVLHFPAANPTGKGKQMLVVVRQLHALDARSPTLQCVASHW